MHPALMSLHSVGGVDRVRAGKLNKIVTHQKTCAKENKQDTVLENNKEDKDLLAAEKTARGV